MMEPQGHWECVARLLTPNSQWPGRGRAARCYGADCEVVDFRFTAGCAVLWPADYLFAWRDLPRRHAANLMGDASDGRESCTIVGADSRAGSSTRTAAIGARSDGKFRL